MASSSPSSSAGSSSGEPVRLLLRLLVAQAVVAAVVEIPFARGSPAAIAGTVAFIVLIGVVGALVRAGTPLSRTVALVFETGVLAYGLFQLAAERSYQGGTIFAGVILAVLLHPAVAAAFVRSGVPAPGEPDVPR